MVAKRYRQDKEMNRKHVSQRGWMIAAQCVNTAGQWGVDVHDVCLTVSDVARYQDVSRSTAWRALQWMEDNGYMYVTTHPYKNNTMKFYHPVLDAPMPIKGL